MKSIIKINEVQANGKYKNVKPKPGKFYFIDYREVLQPEANYFGIAKCTKIFDTSEDGKKIHPPLYEFLHPDKNGELVLALYYADEVVMETNSL
jgi:hypothetical protein